MPTISYIEPDTNIEYTLVVTKAEAREISAATSGIPLEMVLKDKSTVKFDIHDMTCVTTSSGQHSFANSPDFILSASRALKY